MRRTSSRSTSSGWYTEERLEASKTSESMIDAAKDVRKPALVDDVEGGVW